jgi:DNA polymerase-3 subunit gamma/tau
MSYIVLARRWRPQQFEDIIGQDHVSKTLINAIDTNRIAHAYIFAGPRGVGKTTAARILAKALNCEKGPIAKPCNKCSNCESITKGSSLDVLEIDGASNRGIDEIRNLRENIRFTPSQGQYRIYIIDEVHMLTKEAFNALLKTLEEPPSHAIFVFATTEIHRVPATILSRCQRFDFKRIPINTILTHLSHICKSEKIDIENDALLQIAKKADGSMRDAQSILDQIISYTGDTVKASEVATTLGLIDEDVFFEFSEKIKTHAIKDLLLLCQRVFSDGYDLGEFLTGFEEHFRNILVAKALGTAELLGVSEQFQQKYIDTGKEFIENDLIVYIQQIGEIQNQIRWAMHPQMKFELGILKLAKLPSSLDIEQLLQKIEMVKKKGIKKPVNKSEPEPLQKIQLSLDEIKKVWPDLIQTYHKNKVHLANALELAQLISFSDRTLTLEFKKQDMFHHTWLNKNIRLVEEALHDRLKTKVKIKLQIDKRSDEIKPPKKSLDKDDIDKIRQQDPILNKLIDELGLELT